MFECKGNFRQICDDNNLPYQSLRRYKKAKSRDPKFKKYTGWYIISKEIIKSSIKEKYYIYDNNSNVIYKFSKGFQTFCKENDLPFKSFNNSMKNNSIVGNTQQAINTMKHSHRKYKGWKLRKHYTK